MAAVNDGAFVLRGFQNKDIAKVLFPTQATSPLETTKRRAKVTRFLRRLRAHGNIRRIPKYHRYQVSDNGRHIIVAVLTAHDASIASLISAA
ncbi:MAG: hypothetical protein HY812_13245 [Planctomycetes bacterium]|nr:hypothetical protein [Planctomycetota bacterium]